MSTANRALKPYPPASPVTSDTGTATRVAWYNRNRTIIPIRKQSDPTETPEAGQTTTVRVYDETGTLIHTETGITGTSYDYPNATEISDAGEEQTFLTFTLSAVRDGYESLFASTVDFIRTTIVVVGSSKVTEGGAQVVASHS